MTNEISSGTMLGIVLIALAAVIGLGFGVFSIAKGVANEGTVGVQDNLAAVSDSAYEDYNDKIVTGTQVKAAIQNFQGKSVALLVNTTAINKGVKSYKDHIAIYSFTIGTAGTELYVNYGALLAADSAGGIPTMKTVGGAAITKANSTALKNGTVDAAMKDGSLTISHSFAIDAATGKVLFDNSTGGQSRTGNSEYISANSKFTANIIKDTSGVNIGIMFTQLSK